jgi:hypothetical protein
MERGEHILSTVQAALGTLASVFFAVNFIFFEVASFRPDRPAEVTQQIQYLAVAILQDESRVPLVPRWVAYANLWIAVGVVPGWAVRRAITAATSVATDVMAHA